MNVRRSAVALTATAAAVFGAAVPAVAATPAPSATPSVKIPAGLYGSADPTYDGVWRQSLSLLAQHTAGEKPAASAVGWLTGQQCANGAFAAFRADAATACDAKVMVDTNSTAAAVQALAALGGHDDATGKAVTWLKSAQNKDGGWGYNAGGPSDTNSTSVVIGALAATGEDPAKVVKDGASPYDLLAAFSLPCAKDGGALAFQPDKKGALAPNADATAAGVLGALGKGLVTTAGTAKAGACAAASGKKPTPAEVARNGAAYLAQATAENGHLMSVMPGATDQPDYGNTADAVVALAAQGGAKAAQKQYAWLEKNAGAWAKTSGPAAYAQLVLAAHAVGADPRHFGGTDVVAALNATGPAPQAASGEHAKSAEQDEKSGSTTTLWWIIGVGLVAGVGIGFLLSGRRKRTQ
ncbi:prenyltransferase/squalene oxidase repeat-containing protein [Streptomyces sp. NPDC048664]|uniref:prenyltransferase/squalene oxidase repeat-containing protein n=1 Tax=Streptomyces sp. NPDC048664 TaxID=3154505 RepID=UPI0034133068